MNTASVPVKNPVPMPVPAAQAASVGAPKKGVAEKLPLRNLLSVPVACAVGIGIHLAVVRNDPEPETSSYTVLLGSILGLSLLLSAVQSFSSAVRRRMRHMHPIIAGAISLLCVWELVTSGFRWLPLPYFPSPASVLRNLLLDWELLFDSTWHSLFLLVRGYILGALVGIVSGICIGWYKQARYWGMPLLKIIGPIPATAWI